MPKRQSARSSLAPAGLREFEGRALNSRRKSDATIMQSIEQQTSRPDKKRRGNNKNPSVDNSYVHALTMCGYYCRARCQTA